MIRMQNGMLVPDSPVNRMARMAGGAFGVEDGGGPALDLTKILRFEAKEANSVIGFDGGGVDRFDLNYSTNGITWKKWPFQNGDHGDITLANVGDNVWVRGVNPNWKENMYSVNPNFVFKSGNIKIGGTVQSLIDGKGETDTAIWMGYLFAGFDWAHNTVLTEVEEGLLPATNLVENCYANMFQYCDNLVNAPSLPATVPQPKCYHSMFSSSGIHSIILPAPVLVGNCYVNLIRDCANITHVTCLAESGVTYSYPDGNLFGWMIGVGESGTFTKKAGVTYPPDAIPSGWTIEEVD